MLTMPDVDAVRELAINAGVCVRPVLSHVTDTVTGESHVVPIACGSTRENRCAPCADRNRRLRIQQCREGWHLDEEPPEPTPADEDDPENEDDAAGEDASDGQRRVRSTRRRQDVPDLPRLPVETRTVGRTFTAPDGKQWRPSMFLTVTLPSYGRVINEGVPVDPASYDYRRAALDAMHFAKLVDRFWQNLRRATGYQVQYFATVEPQRRLAPHLHAAIRGAIPRALLRQVVAATYHQMWWPPHEEPVYADDQLPVWNDDTGAYCDAATGEPLPTTWDEALDRLDADPDGEPAHVVRFGRQLDMQGIIAGSPDADRRVGYLTKYLTKSISETYDDHDPSEARRAHLDRLAHEVRWLPCSPRCANWLRYGIQPQHAAAGMAPGWCRSKAHDREHLGLGGRRVLVSRRWTGKTLDQHRADRAAIVRAVLEEAGIDPDDHDTYSATVLRPDGQRRYHWSPANPSDLGETPYARVIAHTIRRRQRWREQYEAAKARAAPSTDHSATENAVTAA